MINNASQTANNKVCAMQIFSLVCAGLREEDLGPRKSTQSKIREWFRWSRTLLQLRAGIGFAQLAREKMPSAFLCGLLGVMLPAA
jgi:hypothetical protein